MEKMKKKTLSEDCSYITEETTIIKNLHQKDLDSI